MKQGTLIALAAYLLWGFVPVYWKLLEAVPATQILSHRIVWSLVIAVLTLAVWRRWAWLKPFIAQPSEVGPLILTALLVGGNWLIYVWAVNSGQIVESSLGYFINPLVNVLLGTLFLRERPRPWQWAAIALAGAGVAYLTLSYGRLPWIALALALSFGFYALLHKKTSLGSVEGLAVEMAILFVPALAFLIVSATRGTGAFIAAGPAPTLLLAFAGVVTALPLFLFTAGARRVTMTTLGVLQYIAPTMQFLLGAFVYGEGFRLEQLPGFSLIWVALLLYTAEGVITQRRNHAAVAL